MTEPQHLQPVTALGQMLGKIAVMHREQAALNRQQSEALYARTEAQTRLLPLLLAQLGAGALSPSSLALRCRVAQTAGGGRSPELSQDVPVDGGGVLLAGGRLDVRLLPSQSGRPRLQPSACWLGCTGHPFMFAQQLEDATTRWLQPGESAGEERMLEQVTEGHFTVHHNGQPLEGQPPAPGRPIPEARKRSLALLVDPGPHDTPTRP